MLGVKRALFSRTLRRGDSGEDVRQLQELLASAGFDPGPPDGNFGQRTHNAVVAFQRSRGLDPDGAAGPRTIAALTEAVIHSDEQPGRTGTGFSLHIGLNQVNSAAYGFDVPPLSGCVNDANDMQDLARAKGFRVRQLLDSAATSTAVIDAIESAAQQLQSGDLFWISYSGHGSQVPDPLEEDQRSETWVLYDRQLIDNELYTLWARFRPGVRICVISDSCHSGTVTRDLELERLTTLVSIAATDHRDHRGLNDQPALNLPTGTAVRIALALADSLTPVLQTAGDTRPTAANELVIDVINQLVPPNASSRDLAFIEQPRQLEEDLATRDIDDRASLYRAALQARAGTSAPVCDVLLISGCQDNQTSSDGRPDPTGHQNGAFTKTLRNVWQSATSYADLHARILEQMPPTQTPNLYWATPRNPAFEGQKPFTL